MERLDVSSDSAGVAWEACNDMSCARTGHGVAALAGALYAIGGTDGDRDRLDTVEKYDVAKKIWQSVASLNVQRFGLGVAAFDAADNL
jgi:hypothetical protein